MRDYDREARDLPEHRYAYDFDENLRHYILRSLEPFLPARGRALELGCYEGDFTKLLAQRFEDLTVIDAAESCLAAARQRVSRPVTFLHSRFEDAMPSGAFESIFLVHSLEHLDEPTAVIRRAGSWLSGSGFLFLVVPNANAMSRQIAVKMGLISHHQAVTPAEAEHGHRCTYSLDTLERDARAGGVEVVHRGGVFLKPFANFQFDRLLRTDIIDEGYLEGCYQLGMHYPDLCASVFVVCRAAR